MQFSVTGFDKRWQPRLDGCRLALCSSSQSLDPRSRTKWHLHLAGCSPPASLAESCGGVSSRKQTQTRHKRWWKGRLCGQPPVQTCQVLSTKKGVGRYKYSLTPLLLAGESGGQMSYLY